MRKSQIRDFRFEIRNLESGVPVLLGRENKGRDNDGQYRLSLRSKAEAKVRQEAGKPSLTRRIPIPY
jgi:hypothetical protein